jgi:hypothetical protein
MRVDFHNTIEDYQESAEVIAGASDTDFNDSLTAAHFARHVGSYGAVGFVLLVWLSLQVAPILFDSPKPAKWTGLHLLMPGWTVAALYAVVRVWRAAIDLHGRRTPVRWYARFALPAVALLAVLGLLLFLRRYANAGFEDVRPTALMDWSSLGPLLLPHVGWMAMTIGAHVDYTRAKDDWSNDAWEGRSDLAAPRSLEADETLIRIVEPSARTEHDWHVFRRFIETPNLFLLVISEHYFHTIPKRAFADRGQESQFRDLLVRNIEKRPVAFPVVPFKTDSEAPQ